MFVKYFTYTIIVVLLVHSFSNITAQNNNLKFDYSKCYKDYKNLWIPNSLQVFLELIRKIEESNPFANIKEISSSIVHQMSLDGITDESGVNRIARKKLLLIQQLIPNLSHLHNYGKFLNSIEICALHRMITSNIMAESSDEIKNYCEERSDGTKLNRIFDFENGTFYTASNYVTMCPRENGVIRTYDYGTFSPGIIIASIAAGLNPKKVNLSYFHVYYYAVSEVFEHTDAVHEVYSGFDEKKPLIDNVYAAGMAGELSEVCVFQSSYYKSNISVGLGGDWDNIEFPRAWHLEPNHRMLWQMTDSEILAAIDGLHLADRILSWYHQNPSLRLSQILEVYFSSKEIPKYDLAYNVYEYSKINNDRQEAHFRPDWYILNQRDIGACDRARVLNQMLKYKLREQIDYFSQALQVFVTPNTIDRNLFKLCAETAVKRFNERAVKILKDLPSCRKLSSNYKRPIIDMTVILGGLNTNNDCLEFLSLITEVADLSKFGSYISIMNGSNGANMVRRTNNIFDVFAKLQMLKGQYPIHLSLAVSFSKLIHQINSDLSAISKFELRPRIILLSSGDQNITEEELETTIFILKERIWNFKDLHFIFMTNDVDKFNRLIDFIANMMEMNKLSRNEHFQIIDTKNMAKNEIRSELMKIFRKYPKIIKIPDLEIVSFQDRISNLNKYIEYANTKQSTVYKLNLEDLNETQSLQVRFLEFEYGNLTICKRINFQNNFCQDTKYKKIIEFEVTYDNCGLNEECPEVEFIVEVDKSAMKCFENDCRYPDQVKFGIEIDVFLRNVANRNFLRLIVLVPFTIQCYYWIVKIYF